MFSVLCCCTCWSIGARRITNDGDREFVRIVEDDEMNPADLCRCRQHQQRHSERLRQHGFYQRHGDSRTHCYIWQVPLCEGAWIFTPTQWSVSYIENLLDLDCFESDAKQFNNTGNTLMMLVADIALKEDADYLAALNTYREDSVLLSTCSYI